MSLHDCQQGLLLLLLRLPPCTDALTASHAGGGCAKLQL